MKKVLLLSTIIVFSAVGLNAQTKTSSAQKIGWVDSQVILQQFPEAIKAQGDLDAIIKGWNARVDSMTQDLQQDYADYQKQAATMTKDKQETAQKTLIQKEQTINMFKQQKFAQGGEVYKKQQELLDPVKAKIMKGIEEVSKEEGMNFVFDKSGDILLLYADNAFDITNRVLDKLKRGK